MTKYKSKVMPVGVGYRLPTPVRTGTGTCGVKVCVLTRVYALVRVEARLLREALEAEVALEGPLARVRAHVHLQVRLAAERRVANLTIHVNKLAFARDFANLK